MTDPRRGRRTDSALSRRSMLRGAATLGAALAVAGAAGGCTRKMDDDERIAQQLVDLTKAAQQQQRAAQQLAPKETSYTAALNQVATERGQHVQALRDEINRLYSPAASQLDEPSAASGATISTIDDLRAQLQNSAHAAAVAATEMSEYRAGLLGSISAACVALREVQLA